MLVNILITIFALLDMILVYIFYGLYSTHVLESSFLPFVGFSYFVFTANRMNHRSKQVPLLFSSRDISKIVLYIFLYKNSKILYKFIDSITCFSLLPILKEYFQNFPFSLMLGVLLLLRYRCTVFNWLCATLLFLISFLTAVSFSSYE